MNREGAIAVEAGTEIGGYRLELELGSGGFGSVWRAQHLGSGRTVAIKILTEANFQGMAGLMRHDIEVLAGAAAQTSEHLTRVLEGGVYPTPYIVMEYIDGTDLRRELNRLKRLPQSEVARIGLGVSDGLKALHDLGIIHRDIKPANIMIDRRGVVKVTDFGIAKIVGYHAVSQTGQNPLSFHYAAPEVWEGKPTASSDVYALGAVLFECLGGRPPFLGTGVEVLYEHVNKEPDLSSLPPDTSSRLKRFIASCLEKDQSRRPTAVDSLTQLAQISEELESERLAPVPKAHPERLGPWLIEDTVPDRDWSWVCRHRVTGRRAIVDLHFCSDLESLNEELEEARRAIAEGRRLADSVEQPLDADRFLLGPNETWPRVPPASFAWWTAYREAVPGDSTEVQTVPKQSAMTQAVPDPPTVAVPAAAPEPPTVVVPAAAREAPTVAVPAVPPSRPLVADVKPKRGLRLATYAVVTGLLLVALISGIYFLVVDRSSEGTGPDGAATTVASPGEILFQDDFGSATTALMIRTSVEMQSRVEQGELVMNNGGVGGRNFHAIVPGVYSDIKVGMDVRWTGNSITVGSLGLTCRRDPNLFSAYRLEINPSIETYKLYKLRADNTVLNLASTGVFLESWANGVSHRVELTCSGNRIVGTIDGRIFVTGEDGEYSEGEVSIFSGGPIDIRVDNVSVHSSKPN